MNRAQRVRLAVPAVAYDHQNAIPRVIDKPAVTKRFRRVCQGLQWRTGSVQRKPFTLPRGFKGLLDCWLHFDA
jgi:hypothetical protein